MSGERKAVAVTKEHWRLVSSGDLVLPADQVVKLRKALSDADLWLLRTVPDRIRSPILAALALLADTKEECASCHKPMRGIYGAETICARPEGHPGKCHPIHHEGEWDAEGRCPVSGWQERAAAIVVGTGPLTDAHKDAHLALINERLDSEGLRMKVWGNMTYACKNCGRRELYELEFGVEGPPGWRDDLTYIACPFGAGQCKTCGEEMLHTNFRGDVEYETPRAPSVANVFRVPRQFPTYVTRGMYDDGTVITGRGEHAFLSLNLAASR